MDINRKQSASPRPSSRRRVAAALFLFFWGAGSFCAGFATYVRLGIDGPFAAGLIVSRLERMSGCSISYSSAHLGWFSLLDGVMDVTDVEVREARGAEPWLSIRRVVLEVNLGALLRRTLLINRAVFAEPVFRISSRSHKSRASFAEIPSELPDLPLFPVIRSLEISRGTLARKRPEGGSSADEVLFSHVRAAIENITVKGAERFSVKGTAIGGKLTSRFHKYGYESEDPSPTLPVDGGIRGGAYRDDRSGRSKPSIQNVRPYLRNPELRGSFDVSGRLTAVSSPKPHWTGKIRASLVRCPVDPFLSVASCLGYKVPLRGGTADIDVEIAGGLRNCKARGEVRIDRTALLKGDLFARSVDLDRVRVRFSGERVGAGVRMDVSEAVLPGLTVSMEAGAGKIFSPDATLTIAVKNAVLDMERIFPLIPAGVVNDEDRKRLAEAGLKGRIKVRGGAWSGRISDLSAEKGLQGILGLEADLEKVSGFIPGMGLPVADATGSVHVGSNDIRFKGISLTVGKSPIVLNGRIRDLKTSPQADLFVSTTAQAQDLKPVLENRVCAPHVGSWLGRLIEPRGGISVTLDLKGKLSHPTMKGRIKLDGFQTGLRDFPLPLRKVSGSVRLRGSSVTFSQLKGMIGDSHATLQGEVSSTKLDVAGDLKVSHTDIRRLGVLPKGWTFSGNIPVAIKLKGRPSNVGFSVTADLKSTRFSDGAYISKKLGVPFTLEASGNRNPDRVSVEEAYAIVEKSRIAGKATFRSDGKVYASINLPPKGIPTQVLVSLAHPVLELQPGGRIEGDAIVRREPSAGPVVEMNLSLSHVSLKIPGFYKRTEGMVGKIRLGAKTLQLDVERARTGSSRFFGTLSINDFDHPKVEVVLEYPFMDTTDYTAPPGYVSSLTWGDWIRDNRVIRFLARARGNAFVKVSKGRTQASTFSDFKVSLEGNRGLVRVPSWQLRYADGILRGTALFDIRKETDKPFVLDFQGDQLKMEQLMGAGQEWMRVSGNVLLDGKLEWRLGTKPENNGLDKTGQIELRMQEGVVNRFDILSKISIVNLGSILSGRLPDITTNGLPFRRLTSKITVFDTKWQVKELIILSDAAHINASGMYFGDQGKMDFSVSISPLVGFDKIFSEIFGKMLTRNGKLLTTHFSIRGDYGSPEVRLEPFEGFRSRE